jgi:hypothetical protein
MTDLQINQISECPFYNEPLNIDNHYYHIPADDTSPASFATQVKEYLTLSLFL